MIKKFAALAERQGWSRPITNEMMRKKKHVKLKTYRSASPGWSVGTEMKVDARYSHCKAMGSDSKPSFKECVVMKEFWNGNCANCYHYCHGDDCNLHDQRKRPVYDRDAQDRLREVKKRGYKVRRVPQKHILRQS